MSPDPGQTLAELYERHVETYIAGETSTRNDDDVWRAFREPLDRLNITPLLKPKRIVAPDFDYEFKRYWKNEIWHVYEPVSFDLVEESSILDKANRWVGRAASLRDSADPFRMYLLLGEPRDGGMTPTFRKAQNILNKIPGEKECILESQEDAFADEVAREMNQHSE